MTDHVGFKHKPLMGLAVFLPDVATELADNQDGIAFTHALRYVLGQRTEAGHLKPCRIAVAPTVLDFDARRTRQPERRHRSVATAFDLSSGVARDLYLCLHRPSFRSLTMRLRHQVAGAAANRPVGSKSVDDTSSCFAACGNKRVSR